MVHIFAYAGLSDFESLLVTGLVTVVAGVGGLITWVVKSLVPKLLNGFEDRNKALIEASQKTADAVAKIPEAIKSFELAILGVENRVAAKIEAAKDSIVDEVRDRRISNLEKIVTETGKHLAVTVERAAMIPDPPITPKSG